ncbi:hypothetical protein WN943_003081 [Citrus x changshan-huyou]
MMDDIRTGVVGFNSNSTEILIQRGEKISNDPHTYLGYIVNYNFHNDEDFSSNDLVDDRYLLLALEDIGRLDPNLDFSVDGQQSRKGIKLITSHQVSEIDVYAITLSAISSVLFNLIIINMWDYESVCGIESA